MRLSTQPTDRPIGEIEYLLEQSTHNPLINLEYPEKVAVELMRNEKLTSKPFLLLNHSSLQGLIDSVRNIILKWTLQLEKDGILGEGMTFTKQEKKVASSTVYHIETYIGRC